MYHMVLFEYFKSAKRLVCTSSPWTLSKIVDSEVIKAANEEVTAVLKMD